MKRPGSTRATLKDVAREANVSLSTVSYVINDNQHAQRLTEATIQRGELTSKQQTILVWAELFTRQSTGPFSAPS